MVFQEASLFPWFSVARNVGYGLECQGVKSAEIRAIQQVRDAASHLARAGQVDFSDAYSLVGSAYAVRANSNLRATADVDRPVWKHWLTIVKPDKVTSSKGLLFIGGGKNSDPAPTKIAEPAVLSTMLLFTSAFAVSLSTTNVPSSRDWFSVIWMFENGPPTANRSAPRLANKAEARARPLSGREDGAPQFSGERHENEWNIHIFVEK